MVNPSAELEINVLRAQLTTLKAQLEDAQARHAEYIAKEEQEHRLNVEVARFRKMFQNEYAARLDLIKRVSELEAKLTEPAQHPKCDHCGMTAEAIGERGWHECEDGPATDDWLNGD